MEFLHIYVGLYKHFTSTTRLYPSEHSPRLQAIQVYTKLHKATQGYFYKQQTRQLSLFLMLRKSILAIRASSTETAAPTLP